MEGISRIDSPGSHCHGWFVRVYHPQRLTHSKFFADKKHGGLLNALREAVKYRKKYMEEHKGTLAVRNPRKKRVPQSNNTTGVLGISFTRKLSKNRDRREPTYQVTWTSKDTDGEIHRHSKPFPVHRYDSKEDALAEATRFRKAWEATV